ncbi:MAG: hypothetical protein ABSF63_13965 [Candidatus Bathyarchaeia archaeon]
MRLPRTTREKKKIRVRDRPKAVRKQERLGNHGLCVVVVLLVVVAAPVVVAWYGLTYAAVVDFTFGGTTDVRRSYRLTAMSPSQPPTIDITHIFVRNTGNTDITVIVTLHAVNAVVAPAPGSYYGPYTDTANVQIHLPVASGYQIITFYLALPVQVPLFTLRVSVARVLGFSSFTSLVTSGFASIQPTSPTTLVYTNTIVNPYDYELSQQY